MRLQQYMITELFDTKVPIKLVDKNERKENSVYAYEFKVDDLAYSFTGELYHDRNGVEGEVNILDLEFALGGYFDRNDYEITGTGNALKVFSGVKLCVLDLFKQLKIEPDIITFAADDNEPSRVKLYDRFMKALPKLLKGYKFDRNVKGRFNKNYKFKRKGR
jgi:hypothetical protein